ncbi:MAG: CinA family nicotinamide mononucleotide deamidase-related protein [Pirellulales bacterium]
MLAEVISIGDELTSGQRLDTNSQWLSERLGELGVKVMYHTTVADDLQANVRVFRQAAQRVDLVVSSGGLGPTADDLTREALAQAAGVELALDESSLAYIRGLFARRQRPMPERNVVQAMFPIGSRVVPNPQGTAPGIDMDLPRPDGQKCRVFALPGVPAEMREMWQATLAPTIAATAGGRLIRHRRFKCFGVGESDLEAMLPDLIRRGREPQVGITVSGATITLRITADGTTPDECHAKMDETIATIRDCLGELVFGEEEDELEHAITRLLIAQGKTLATAEWGTGGMIAHRMVDFTESKGRYLGGIVAAAPAALRGFLGSDAELVARHGAVSGEVAEALARGCRERLGADYGLAVSDFPAYDPQAAQPHSIYYALATPAGVTVKASPYVGHSDILKVLTAKRAMNLLRLELLGEAAAARHRPTL